MQVDVGRLAARDLRHQFASDWAKRHADHGLTCGHVDSSDDTWQHIRFEFTHLRSVQRLGGEAEFIE